MYNIRKATAEGLGERCNKAEERFTEEMTFELVLELGFHRSRGRWGGRGEGGRACQANESAGADVRSTWAHSVSGNWLVG